MLVLGIELGSLEEEPVLPTRVIFSAPPLTLLYLSFLDLSRIISDSTSELF